MEIGSLESRSVTSRGIMYLLNMSLEAMATEAEEMSRRMQAPVATSTSLAGPGPNSKDDLTAGTQRRRTGDHWPLSRAHSLRASTTVSGE